MERLEQRMYGLVPYNISPIQAGIQFGHAVVEYGLKNFHNQVYLNWAKYDKTFIILNGGTTNTNVEKLGTLNTHLSTLKNNDVNVSEFYEPDLGDQLTAVVFLVDERVYNKEKYPDFNDYLKQFPDIISTFEDMRFSDIIRHMETVKPTVYRDWVASIGGEENLFLRNFLRNFKLA